MRIYFLLFLLLISASINANSAGEHLSKALQECSRIQSDFGRLVCYDNLNKAQEELNAHQASQTVDNSSHVKHIDKRSKPDQLPALIADLNEAGFGYSVGRMDLLGSEFDAMMVSLGHRINAAEITFSNQPTIYFNVFGQIRSQFDVEELSTRNNRGGALINTDFTVSGFTK